MRLLVILFLFGGFFIFKGKAFFYCHLENNPSAQWEQVKHQQNNSCCEITDKQWELMKWYFLRVGSHLNVTEIVREADFYNQSLYMSYFLKDLYKYTGLEYYTHIVRYKKKQEVADERDPDDNTYQWHAELPKLGNSTYYIEEDKLDIRAQILMKNWNREDEPDSGNVVLAKSIETIDHFLNGKTKQPFESKRSYYIILIYHQITHDWDMYASSILSKLWKVHGILNAIVVGSCKKNNVGIFDPFANTHHLNRSDIDEWGIYRCFPIKYLDYMDNWLIQKDYSLNGFPLTVSIFNRYPTMVPEIPETFAMTQYARGMKYSGFGGIDGFLLGNLAEYINFTIQIIQPDNSTYGFKTNGQFTGTIADVLYGRADIAFNSRFLIHYGTDDIEYLVPILGDKMCVIMPATKKRPQWKAIFKCFDVYFWFTFFLITAVSSIIFCVLKYFQEKQQRRVIRDSLFYKDYKNVVIEEKITVKSIFYATWQVMIGMNAILPIGTVERLLIGSCLVANIIISGSFESSLYRAYTKSTDKDIDTLRELDSSGLNIIASSPSLRNTFGNWQTRSELLLSLKGKLLLEVSERNGIDRAAEDRDVCSLERYSDVEIIIKTKFLNDDGTSKLHVIKECPRHYFLTYIVYKDWPFMYRFNKVLHRFAEGGFGTLWYEKTEEAFFRTTYVRHQMNKYRKPFSLEDIQTPFYILYFGYTISFVVFLIEKFILPPKKFDKIGRLINPVDSVVKDFEANRRKKFSKFCKQSKHLKVRI